MVLYEDKNKALKLIKGTLNMNFKIEYLIDKNRIVTILRKDWCEHTIYALEK